MSKNYRANPIDAPLITRPGESTEYVGTRNVTGLLPEIFRTQVNKRFLDSTLEQLMSSGSLQAINHYVGAKTHTRNIDDSYVEDGRTSDPYQFVPGLVNKDTNGSVTNAITYDDLLHNMNFSGVHLNQNSRVFDEEGYTLDLPINYDMFVNYHKYFWVLDSIPVIDLIPNASNPITIDDIIGKFEYTSPALSNGKTLTLENGMRIRFESIDIERIHQTVANNQVFTSPISNPTESNVYLNNVLQTEGVDYNKISATEYEFTTAPNLGDEIEIHCFWTVSGTHKKEEIYIVDGVGKPEGISFTQQFVPVGNVDNYGKRVWFNQTIYSGRAPTRFDQVEESFEFKPFDLRELKMQAREYTVEERTSQDQSAWARSNLWVKQNTIENICDFLDEDPALYTKEIFRATRPIIEYKANIKKYNYGTKHLTFVDYMFDELDPANDIIGQTYFDIARHLVSDEWVHKGYNKGDLVKRTIGGEITYWDCKQTHGEAFDPTQYENRKYWNQIYSRVIEDNELVLFTNCTDVNYNNKIFRVSGYATGNLALTLIYDLTDYEVGHKIMCVNGYNAVFYDSYNGYIYSGSEWYWDGTTWVYGQQKEHTSQGALFQLYDTDLVELQDTTVYPNSTFKGDRIFDYGKGSGRVDESLGFAPRYVDYGNTPGLSFDLELGAKRYEYNVIKENNSYHQTFDTGNIEEITGYYFYKMLDADKYYNGWKLLRNGQPVKRHASFIATGDVVVELGTTDLNTDNKFVVHKDKNGFKFATTSTENSVTRLHNVSDVNPDLFMSKDRTYYVQSNFSINDLEFTDFDGNVLSNFTKINTDAYNTEIQVNAAFTGSVIRYREVGNTTNTGLIWINDNTDHKNVEVFVNGKTSTNYTIANTKLTVTANNNDTVDVYWHSDAELSVNADGNFVPADTHLYNAMNDWATEVSFGDLQEHLRRGMTRMPGFTGDYFGDNNYVDLPHAHDFDGTIRKQPYSTALLNQLSADIDTNVYNSLKYAARSYKKFKKQFLRKVEQLHKQTPIETPVHEIVDGALASINLGKSINSPYANSNMAMFKDYESVDYVSISGETLVFDLPQIINTYHDAKNHIQAWVEDADGWHSLVKGVDYTLSDNKITITKSVTYKTNNTVATHIRWYPQNTVSYVPPSAVKLGLIKMYQPTVDTSYIEGHDGSIVERSGSNLTNRSSVDFSINDAALWDLELRIYNNLNENISTVVDYKEIMPNANRPTPYDWDNFIAALEPDFKHYSVTENLTTLTDSSFDSADEFTWNYSSVGNGIGGWKGIYTYYFNTVRPHTHPWEMLGHNTKPTWWDSKYNWTNSARRFSLINALKTGHYNNPDDAPKYNKAYAYTGYDWDNNTLVTVSGELNGPVTAGIVTAPGTVERAADFTFGDMGNVEFEWVKTSEFKILQILALLRLRPLWVTNTYYDSTNRSIISNANIPDDIVIDSDLRGLGNYKNKIISNINYSDSIIERILVKSSSDVTTVPSINIFGNYGSEGAARAIVENNRVVGITVTNPGKDYQSKPGLVFDEGTITTEVFLRQGAKRYKTGLNNAIVDFAEYNNTNANTLADRFTRAAMQPIIKAGGFVNPNRQSVVLESSQDKGKVTIPEENIQTLLYLNQPNKETFMGALQFTKLEVGFRVAGIDRNTLYANYFKPAENSRQVYVNLANTSLVRYTKFLNTPSRIYYGTTFNSLQDAYSFLLGHGEYLKSEGWITNWKTTADLFARWSETAEVGKTYVCIPDTQKFEINDGTRGYYDTVINRYDGINNLIDETGSAVPANKIVVSRPINSSEDPITTIETKSDDTNILGLRLYRVELEHVLVVDNETDFDDVIYKPEIGQRHLRVIWKGARTKDWNGKLYTPGYLVNNNTIIDNFDTTANSTLEYFNESSAGVNNTQMTDTARFNVGYNKPQWSEYLNLDNDTVFNFTKSTRKYRGTKFGLNAFMRNTSMLGGQADANLYEMWALRTADFGDIRSRDTVEFELNTDILSTSPQVVQFHADDVSDIITEDIINIDPTSNLLVTGSTENVFRTRAAKKYNTQSLADMDQFENDFVTAGLPLLTETDYRVINKEDFTAFPVENKTAYDFSGDWQEVDAWNNRVAYKFNDKVIQEGYVWRMRDPDGSSGLQRPNDPIEVIGRNSLPIIPSDGQTISIDGTVVTIQRTSESTTLNTIELTGTENLNTSGVPHGSTLILGQSSSVNQTLVFDNEVSNIVFQDVTKTGTVVNPTITGGPTSGKELIIDGVTISFDDSESSVTNVTIQQGFTQAFNSTFVTNTSQISTLVSARISAIETLRQAFINTSGLSSWDSFLASYFSNASGLNFGVLQSFYGGSFDSELDALANNDMELVNSITNNSYTDPFTILASDTTATKNALDSAPYITNIRNFAVNNSSSTFAASEVIATETGTSGKVYNLTEIIQKINNASIPNVTAGQTTGGNLIVTKTTNDTSQPFSLTISAASANSDVGFATANQTINSSGITIIDTPDLTLSEVVNQINAANIPNISAVGLASGQLQILCSASTLFVGPGNANTFVGITEGVIPATVTVISVDRTSDLTDTISSINNASLPGITASNSNNRLRIVSTNETMTIGEGTANSTLGITAQVYYATQSVISNVFNELGSDGESTFSRVDIDPFIFSIWAADNSEQSNINAGYNVYQSMHFGFHITKACEGNFDADEAQITIAAADYSNDLQHFHNLNVGDYVLIAGSNTTPSVDGVHRVTRIDTDNPNQFYIDEYINQEGNSGNVYPLRSVRFSSYADLIANFNTFKVNPLVDNNPAIFNYNFASKRSNGDPIYAFVDDDNGAPAVYRWTGGWSLTSGHYDGEWVKVRSAPTQARNDLIENVKLYDANRRTLITALEIYDPAKGIIPSFVESEIEFKSTADMAVYNYDSYNGYEEIDDAWTDAWIGKRWWNLATSIYLDYEQGPEKYQQQQWGRLFPGSEIEIYEWIRSPVMPEEYEQLVTSGGVIDGSVASGEPYSVIIDGEIRYYWTEKTYYNPVRNRSETNYYFWVKNKQSASGIRNYNVLQLANIMTNFKDLEIAWAAASTSNTLLLANADKFVTNDTVTQINQIYESNSLPLNEWTLLAECDPAETIPEYLHIKIRDSLAGYNNYRDLYTYTEWSATTVYNRESVVIKDNEFFICLKDSVTGGNPTTDTLEYNWAKIYNYILPPETEATDIEVWRGQPVPDLRLHPFNRYGHLTRPVQSLYRDITTARQNFVDAANDYLKDICVTASMTSWDDIFYTKYTEGEVEYKLEHYWNFVDWTYREYSDCAELTYEHDTSTLADFVVDTVDEIISRQANANVIDVPNGSYVYVKYSRHSDGINRPEMWYKENDEFSLRWKKYGTIELSDELWLESKFGHGFDAAGFDISGYDSGVANIINLLFDLFRDKIFIGQHKDKYNKLWFRCLYQAVIEGTADDFAFKTTYVKLGVDHPLILDPVTYQHHSTTAIEKYFADIKPFHTKLHTLEQRPTVMDSATVELSEVSRDSEITIQMNDYARHWNGDVLLSGGTFTEDIVEEDYAEEGYVESDYFRDDFLSYEFLTPESTVEVLYDGNEFIQPGYERIGEELVGLDLLENVRIRVQTNASGSTEDADTRSFQINMFTNFDIQESIVILDANKTTISNNITESDTTITVDDASVLGNDSGIIWIGTERISYDARDGNTLRYCRRGTLGTSAIAHTAGDTVVDAGLQVELPVRERLGNYRDTLRSAYNEPGVSLSSSSTESVHRFIRNAGAGTI